MCLGTRNWDKIFLPSPSSPGEISLASEMNTGLKRDSILAVKIFSENLLFHQCIWWRLVDCKTSKGKHGLYCCSHYLKRQKSQWVPRKQWGKEGNYISDDTKFLFDCFSLSYEENKRASLLDVVALKGGVKGSLISNKRRALLLSQEVQSRAPWALNSFSEESLGAAGSAPSPRLGHQFMSKGLSVQPLLRFNFPVRALPRTFTEIVCKVETIGNLFKRLVLQIRNCR